MLAAGASHGRTKSKRYDNGRADLPAKRAGFAVLQCVAKIGIKKIIVNLIQSTIATKAAKTVISPSQQEK